MTSFTIGITGNRDLESLYILPLKERVRRVFRDIVKEYSSIKLLSPLADGADRIVVEVALEDEFNNLMIQVPIPFDEKIYKSTFAKGLSHWNAKNDFGKQQLETASILDYDMLVEAIKSRNQKDETFILVDFDKVAYDKASLDDQRIIRRKQYIKVGEYIAAQSHLLIGIYDENAKGKVGGTKEIIEKKRQKQYEYFNEAVASSSLCTITILHGTISMLRHSI